MMYFYKHNTGSFCWSKTEQNTCDDNVYCESHLLMT